MRTRVFATQTRRIQIAANQETYRAAVIGNPRSDRWPELEPGTITVWDKLGLI